MINFLCYPKCSTCQKAKRWLESNNISFTERHIVDNNPTYEELKKWFIKSGLPIKRFFNTSGVLYKELSLKEKLHKIIWARKPTTLEWWDESRLPFSTLRLYISLNSSGGDFTYATSKITI